MNYKYLLITMVLSMWLHPILLGQTASRYAMEDAVIIEAFPDSVYQRPNNNLFAYRHDFEGALKRVQSYVSFDISSLKGTQIESANLNYRGKTGAEGFADQFEIELFSLKGTLDTEGLTWANKPNRDKKLASSLLNASSARKAFINDGSRLIDYINESIRKGEGKVSFMIRSAMQDSTSNMWIGGKGDGSFGPILEYTVSTGGSNYAIEDAVVLQAYPDSVFARPNNNLFAYRESVDGELKRRMSFVKFDISHLTGSQVDAASFSYRGKTGDSDFADQFEIELLSLKDDFTEEGITWSSKPRNDKVLGTSILNTSSSRKAFVNDGSLLIDYINESIRKGAQTIGFAIRSVASDSTANMWIGGKGDGSFGPILEYSVTPNASQYGTGDAVVLQAHPDSVFARSNNNIFAYRENVEGELKRVQSYVKFDISHLKGSQLETASFSYRGKTGANDFADQFGLELFSLKGDFESSGMTWNTKPAQDKKLASSLLNNDSARKSFVNDDNELVSYINEEIRKGNTSVGFMIRSTGKDSTSNMWIGGIKDGSFGPVLDYTVAPAKSSYGTEDAVVIQTYPDSVFARSNNNIFAYRERVDGNLNRIMSFVKFDISGLTTEVEGAEFSYRGKTGDNDFADQFDLELMSLKGDFSAEGLTWNTKPSNDKKLGTSTLTTDSGRKAFLNDESKLVDYINEALRKGQTTIGFAVRSTAKDTTSNMWMGGIKDGNYGPLLDISLPNLFKLENDTLTVIEDVFVAQAEPETNFEIEDADMHVILDTTNMASKEIYLKFNLGSAKSGIGAATLLLRGAQKDPPSAEEDFRIEIFGTDSDDWAEAAVTWDTKPEVTTGALASYNITASQVHEVQGTQLTDYINTAIELGRDDITFVVRGKEETTFRAWISSKNWVAAKLALDYSFQEKTVIEDSYVAEGTPDANFDQTTAMQVAMDTDAQNNRETYLKFDLKGARSNVITTNLILKGDQERSATVLDDFYVQLYGVTDNSWDETSLTWNNKPASDETLLLEYNITKSDDHELSSAALNEYIKEAVRQKQEKVSFVLKGRDNTPGSNAWISDQGWKPAKLFLDYRLVASAPLFVTPLADYVPEVTVELSSQTPGASIHYTVDGSDPSAESAKYEGGIMLTDTTTIRAIAIAPGLAASEIVEATYNVAPVGTPQFTPNPQVEYQNSVTVTIEVAPADAFLFYSIDGGEPLTPYPSEGILVNETTTIRARGVSADGNDLGPILEATYTVVNTVAGTGTGPGGVGASDNSISGQPENPLWLRADAITDVADGEAVTTWADVSGNANDAYNTFVENGDNAIPNTSESQKPAPIFLENQLNGLPSLQFGAGADATPNRGSLIIDDADNLDGGAGISLFMVFKRNQLLEGFASVFQKRDIGNGNEAQAYVLEFNGGADPNKMQFVIERQLFLRNDLEFNADDYYIVNSELQEAFGDVLFRTNGIIEKVSSYNNVIPAVDAPVIIAGFQAMDIAEVILYKKGLNEAQNVIVHNYLAAKYGLSLGEDGNDRLYQSETFTSDLIGIGKTFYIDGQTEQEHRTASGAGLQIDGRSPMSVGDFVLAAHNGMEVTNAAEWERIWNVEVFGGTPNVNLIFDFAAVGAETPGSSDNLRLFYHDGTEWTDLGLEGTLDGDQVLFAVDGLQSGEYALGNFGPATRTQEIDLSESLKVFPNPVSNDQIRLELGNTVDGDLSIHLFDLMGREVLQWRDAKQGFFYQRNLDLAKLPEGIYTLKVLQDNQYRSIKKIIKN
ncbi:MAG: DNRLRE domain-containing protein [Saprospiraceae bacterium]|nr:DNRLRE domain-containing protein [Saprospiraceae bacterium]